MAMVLANGSCKNSWIISSVSAPSWVVAPLENTSTALESRYVLTLAVCGTLSSILSGLVVPSTVIVTVPVIFATSTRPGCVRLAGAGAAADEGT